MRCAEDKHFQKYLCAISSFTSIRRIIDVVKTDISTLTEVEKTIFPCIVKTLSADGTDSIDESIDCITTILHHGYKDKPISQIMW